MELFTNRQEGFKSLANQTGVEAQMIAGKTRFLLIPFVALSFLLIGIKPVSAGPLDAADVQVNTTSVDDQMNSAVAMSPDGKSVICWQHKNGAIWDIKAQRYDSSGNAQGGEISVALVTNNQEKPAIAMDSSGNFVVVWEESTGASRDVFFQRFDANGNPAAGQVNATPWGFDQTVPSVGMDSSGNFTIAFQHDLGGTNDNITCVKYRQDGVYLGTDSVATGANDERIPSIAMNQSGDFAVSWQEYVATNWDVLVRKYYNSGGSTAAIPVRANSNDQGESVVAIDDSGRFIVCWQEYLGSNHDVYAQKYASNGSLLDSKIEVADGSSDQKYPAVAMNVSGSFVVCYQEYIAWAANWSILFRRYNSSATSLEWIGAASSAIGNNQEYSAVAVNDNGGSVIAWEVDGNQDGSGKGIYKRRFSNISTTWYFAEGYTGEDFEEWLVLQNPNPVPTTATITYYFRGGTPVAKTVTIPADSRETISINSDVGDNREVSVKVDSDQPIIAERPMYFNYQNKWQGGHNTIGATSPVNQWYFAEGYTGEGFEEWLTLQNPNGTDATVTIVYFYRGGTAMLIKTKTVPANSRETISVNEDAGENQEVSIYVSSTQHLVVERPTYFSYQFVSPTFPAIAEGGHNTIGATSDSSNWYFAEGYTGFEQWLTLQNANGVPAAATITYYFRDGAAPLTTTLTIPANSRETVNVNADVGDGREVSIKVQSTIPIVAERPIYFLVEEAWDGGHNTIGATSPVNQWFFAEGYTGSGFQEWLTLQNPNATNATATITYTFRGGATPVTRTITIPANSRETVEVNADVGTNKEVSIKVDSTEPIIAERPMYFSYQDKWTGGHNTIGFGP